MGQATLDLPDPPLSGVNAGPLSPQALASADDLLSQLAGDDIDRLLAEADTERPPAPVAAPVRAGAPPGISVSPAAVAPAVATDAQKASDASTADAVTSAAIDAVLASAVEAPVQAIEKPAEPAEPAAPVESALAQPTFEAVDQKLLDEAAAQVASIMDPPVATADPVATPSLVADSAEREALSEPLILPEEKAGLFDKLLWPLVKVLELINAPMNFFSDEVREGMGKIALVTTFNAAAVLVYVMVFRRGHH